MPCPPLLAAVALTLTSAGGNLAPSVPVPLNPSESQGATTTTPVFSWRGSVDPEGGAILYEVEVYSAEDRLVGSVGVRGTVTAIAAELENGGAYWWHVRAVDDLGLASDFSPVTPFTVDAPVDDPEVAVNGGGCDAGGDRGGALALVLAAVAALVSRRRRYQMLPDSVSRSSTNCRPTGRLRLSLKKASTVIR